MARQSRFHGPCLKRQQAMLDRIKASLPSLAPAEQRVGKLARSVSEGVPFVHRSVDVDDKTSDVLVKVIDNTVAANYSLGSWR